MITTHCDYCQSPLGIDMPAPLLGWHIGQEADDRSWKQSAYRIRAASSMEKLLSAQADLWDSGKVISELSQGIPYAGSALGSRQQIFWQVKLWDALAQETDWSQPACWEMGLLRPEDWKASWIGYTGGWNGQALYFRSRFFLSKPIRKARAYVCGLGYYELRLNGSKVGDHVLEPGWTDYSSRILYTTYDITSLLAEGVNVAGVAVGNGWYGQPKLLLQIEVTHEDGSHSCVFSEGGHSANSAEWFVSSGPITRNSIYDGESYDARAHKDGWDWQNVRNPMGDAKMHDMWQTAVAVPAPGGVLVAQTMEPIKVVDTFRPQAIHEPTPGLYVFDAGTNLAGWARLDARAPEGTTVSLRFAESLKEDGTIDQENLQKAAQSDTYTFSRKSNGSWEPSFTYHGFRYIQLEGLPEKPTDKTLTVCRVRSAVEQVGSFRCSSALLNKIQDITVNTEASNLHSVPTDCPQRGERLGWLNDMTVRSEQALYNFRLARLYRKWVDDIADTQRPDGTITDTAPFKWGKRPADPVSASFLLTAWQLFEHYGDISVIHKHFGRFELWVDYMRSRCEESILSYSSWGDWAPPMAFAIHGSVSDAVSSGTPGALVSTAFLYKQLVLLADMADALGKPTEAQQRREQATQTATAFNHKFWNEATGGYGSSNQACNALALQLGLVPAERTKRTVLSLVRAVENNDFHLSTGNLATKYLLEALSEHGHCDLAFRIATQTTYPGWGYMLANGATSLWERWEYATGSKMNSHNHPMLGSVSSWMYKYLAGIRPTAGAAGFSQLRIQPQPVKGLDWVEGIHTALNGTIRSAWRKERGRLHMEVTVPPNCQAQITLPGDAAQITESGTLLHKSNRTSIMEADSKIGTIVLTGSGKFNFNTPMQGYPV